MKLLFDIASLAPWKKVKFHGGSEYGKELFKLLISYLYKHPNSGIDLYGVALSHQKLNDFIYDEFKNNNRLHLAEDIEGLISIIEEQEPDVFYSPVPYFLSKYKDRLKKLETRFKGTIHGTRQLELGWDPIGYYYRTDRLGTLKHSVKRMLTRQLFTQSVNQLKNLVEIFGENFLTVSNHTKFVLNTLFPGLSESKIIVSQLSPPSLLTDLKQMEKVDNPLTKLGVRENQYFLIVSANRVEKNSYRIIKAISKYLSEETIGKKFLILGADNVTKSKLRRLIGSRSDLVFADYLDADDYASVVSKAYALIYFSLTEGFGFPPLEMMKYGKPSLISGTTAMPTVYRKGVVFGNPRSELEIASRIKMLALDHELYSRLRCEALDEYKRVVDELEKSKQETIRYIID